MPHRAAQILRVHPRHSLVDGLVAAWPLGEASGRRFDARGNNHLDDVNSVGQGDGLLGKAGQFVSASVKYLSAPDNPLLSLGPTADKFALTAWVNFDTLPAPIVAIAAKNDGSASPNWEFSVFAFVPSTNLEFWIEATNPTFGYTGGGQSTGGPGSTGVWYFVYAFADGANLGISVNNNPSPATTPFNGIFSDSTSPFQIGAVHLTDGPFNGRIQHVNYWKGRTLTRPEQDWLYNAGKGRAYPFLP
jgi:hypothetical protein